jgi:hypothetical protein
VIEKLDETAPFLISPAIAWDGMTTDRAASMLSKMKWGDDGGELT